MQFIRPYTFAFSIRNAWQSLLSLSVVMLIPIAGMMVILGYRAEMAEDLDADPDDSRCGDFQFDRFGDLLTRGIWAFLYAFAVGLIWGMLYVISYFAFLALLISSGPKLNGPLILIALLTWVFFITGAYLFLTLLSWPFLLYSSLTRRFAFGEAFRFSRDFFSKVGWSVFGIVIPKIVFDSIAYTLGFCLCFVGIYPAWVVVMLAEQHFINQLYRLYLARGGTRIAVPEVVYLREVDPPTVY